MHRALLLALLLVSVASAQNVQIKSRPPATGTASTYTINATTGQIPAITVAPACLTAQGANVGATTLVTPGTAGRFRLCGYVAVTRQATTSATIPNVVLRCTDPTDSVVKDVEVTFAVQGIAANPTTANAHGGCGLCDAKVSTAVQYLTTDYASVGGTSMQFKLCVTLEPVS